MTDSPPVSQQAGPSAAAQETESSTAAGSDASAKNPASRFVPPRPTPVWTCKITLNTDFAQRVYRRTWDRLKADLYVLTVRTRSSGMDDAAKAIESVISEAFEHARKDIEGDLARSEAIMDDVKLTELPTYKGAQTVEAEYSTPRAKEFLNLLLQMDQLLTRYDALWLTGQIETQQRIQRSQNWQRRLIKIANRLRELGNRTRAGLTREMEKRTEKSEPTTAGVTNAEGAESSVTLEDLDGSAGELEPDTQTAAPTEPAMDEFVSEDVVTQIASSIDEEDTLASERQRRHKGSLVANA